MHLKVTNFDVGNWWVVSDDLLEIQAATIDLIRMQDNNQTEVSFLGDMIIEINQISALNNHIGVNENIVLKVGDVSTVGADHCSVGGFLLM
ncbi:hypothetical protein V4B17_01060 [Bartonella sp. B23]